MNSKKIDLKELLKEKKKIALGGHVRPGWAIASDR